MALSANTIRSYGWGNVTQYPVLADATIYEGSAVGLSSGYARALTAGHYIAHRHHRAHVALVRPEVSSSRRQVTPFAQARPRPRAVARRVRGVNFPAAWAARSGLNGRSTSEIPALPRAKGRVRDSPYSRVGSRRLNARRPPAALPGRLARTRARRTTRRCSTA
jgi:hypothetical protein